MLQHACLHCKVGLHDSDSLTSSVLILQMTLNSTKVQNPRRKLDDKLPYVFGSVLTCAMSARYVFQKPSYSLCELCLSLFPHLYNSSSDSKVFQRFIAFSGSPTAVHRVLSFSSMRRHGHSHKLTSSLALRYCTVSIYIYTFLRRIALLHSIACTTVLH